jgi:hypothetical protein
VDGAADSLGADEASLMLVEGDNLRGASSTRTCAGEAEAWQQRARLGEGVAGWVAQTGSAVLLSEGDDLSRFPNLVSKGVASSRRCRFRSRSAVASSAS